MNHIFSLIKVLQVVLYSYLSKYFDHSCYLCFLPCTLHCCTCILYHSSHDPPDESSAWPSCPGHSQRRTDREQRECRCGGQTGDPKAETVGLGSRSVALLPIGTGIWSEDSLMEKIPFTYVFFCAQSLIFAHLSCKLWMFVVSLHYTPFRRKGLRIWGGAKKEMFLLP